MDPSVKQMFATAYLTKRALDEQKKKNALVLKQNERNMLIPIATEIDNRISKFIDDIMSKVKATITIDSIVRQCIYSNNSAISYNIPLPYTNMYISGVCSRRNYAIYVLTKNETTYFEMMRSHNIKSKYIGAFKSYNIPQEHINKLIPYYTSYTQNNMVYTIYKNETHFMYILNSMIRKYVIDLIKKHVGTGNVYIRHNADIDLHTDNKLHDKIKVIIASRTVKRIVSYAKRSARESEQSQLVSSQKLTPQDTAISNKNNITVNKSKRFLRRLFSSKPPPPYTEAALESVADDKAPPYDAGNNI